MKLSDSAPSLITVVFFSELFTAYDVDLFVSCFSIGDYLNGDYAFCRSFLSSVFPRSAVERSTGENKTLSLFLLDYLCYSLFLISACRSKDVI